VEEVITISGKIVGYDPGGNDEHGVSELIVDNDRPLKLSFATVSNAQAALDWFANGGIPIAVQLSDKPGRNE
jgi:hypothetical protein